LLYIPMWNGGKLSAKSRAHLAIDLRFHDLRLEAGSRWTDTGWSLSHVQRTLGHADLRMTSVYTNAELRHLQDSLRRYGRDRVSYCPILPKHSKSSIRFWATTL
jgi:integrase